MPAHQPCGGQRNPDQDGAQTAEHEPDERAETIEPLALRGQVVQDQGDPQHDHAQRSQADEGRGEPDHPLGRGRGAGVVSRSGAIGCHVRKAAVPWGGATSVQVLSLDRAIRLGAQMTGSIRSRSKAETWPRYSSHSARLLRRKNS